MNKILWLCSWYPHPGDPYEGDFIQRHAKALHLYAPVTVFYVSQEGISKNVAEDKIIEQDTDGINERIIFFQFKGTGIKFIDKLVYNSRYYSIYKKNLEAYISKEGKPAIVHIHVPMKAGILGRWIKKKWGIPYIVSEHSSHYNGRTDDDFSAKSFFHQYNVKQIFRNAIAVTNVSAIIAGKLKKLFGIDDVRVIHNTVDTRFFYYLDSDVSKFRFIHVSTLGTYQKNIDGMLRSFSILASKRQDFELVIVGPASKELKEKVTRSELASFVNFTGEMSYPAVAKEMQQASALVLFSRYENFPCVMIEALCCGLPVIAADTGGIKEAVNETNGILVESENEEQLTAALNRIMNEYDKFDRKTIANEANRQFCYETIGKQFHDLYNEVTKNKGSE
ncbi:MAG: glycosyltransferase [Chitinophagaceae bacterium]